MADENVRKAQKYLNSMYGHRTEWVTIEENGNTGTATIKGIIRAFQIQNNIEVVGAIGPTTLSKMKSLEEISKMDPNGSTDPNVSILQCTLFAKGYNAGGITGIYYTTGVNAVKQLQSDANIGVTGIINWKVWSALLSFNWFTKSSISYDSNVQLIQRQLNGSYSDYLNVRACDGYLSRETAQSLLGALQVEEGLLSGTTLNLNELNFGEQTKSKFPEPLNNGNSKTQFNKLVQYGLYFNGYNPQRFDGVFDSTTQAAVSEFQHDCALTGVIKDDSGVVGVQTMMSLLISKGDPDRPAFACDCSTILNQTQANDLKSSGYNIVGRYLTGTVGGTTSKALTVSEIKRIRNAGLGIFPIYQDGGYYLNYFKPFYRGATDAQLAIEQAQRLGFPHGTIIYFAVDFDCLPQDTSNYIIHYFEQINMVFNITGTNSLGYKVGVYAPRQVCIELSKNQLTASSFISDMSRGFTGNCGYPLPNNWSFDQFSENKGFSSTPSFDLDKDAMSLESNRDKGCYNFVDMVDQDYEERLLVYKRRFLNKFINAMGYVKDSFGYKFKFEGDEKTIDTFNYSNIEISCSLKTSSSLTVHPSSGTKSSINIVLDKDGNVSTSMKDELENLMKLLDFDNSDEYKKNVLNKTFEIAEEMQRGKIVLKFEYISANSCSISIVWEDNTIKFEGNQIDISIEYKTKITVYNNKGFEINPEYVKVAVGAVVLVGGVYIIAVAAPAGAIGGSVWQLLIFLGIITPSV